MFRVAINGFGRIGKMFLRAALEQNALGKEFEVVAINSRSDINMHAHLFKYDSTFGKVNANVSVKDGKLVVGNHTINWIQEKEPENLPWKDMNIDLVLESTGEFATKEFAEKHIKAGAKYVLVSAPCKGAPMTIVPGVNDSKMTKENKIYSLASCTTNCLAPVLNVINKKFGIERGFLITAHAYTNDQRIIDSSHDDWRRARAGAVNIVPTKTGAAMAIGEVIPELAGKMDGSAYRVPVPCGSINDMTLVLKKPVKADEINTELKRASEHELKGILAYTDEQLVSSDIVGNPHSAIVDSKLTKAMDNLVKVAAWYDNEWGYSNRLVDFVKKMGKM
ncbi:MAG: type I glyceraldehyde-3-phosphate dehydrogenase [Candidatus Micrarchaeota archaeon]